MAVPRLAPELAARFQATPIWAERKAILDDPDAKKAADWKRTETQMFKNSWLYSLRLTLWREWTFVIRDKVGLSCMRAYFLTGGTGVQQSRLPVRPVRSLTPPSECLLRCSCTRGSSRTWLWASSLAPFTGASPRSVQTLTLTLILTP